MLAVISDVLIWVVVIVSVMNGGTSVSDARRSKSRQQRDELSADRSQLSAGGSDEKKSSTVDAAAAADDVQDDVVADVDDDEEKIPDWIRCSPANLYFKRDSVVMN